MDWTDIADALVKIAAASLALYFVYFNRKSKLYKKRWFFRVCIAFLIFVPVEYSFKYWSKNVANESDRVERVEKLRNSVVQQGTLATSDFVFESPEGYRILIPSGYTYSKPAGTQVKVDILAIKNFDTSQTPGVSVLVGSSNATNEQFSDRFKKGMQQENSTTKFTDPVKFRNGRTEIERVEMTAVRKNGPAKMIMLFASSAGKNYAVIIGTKEELFSAATPEFERIVRSFSLSKWEEKPVANQQSSVPPRDGKPMASARSLHDRLEELIPKLKNENFSNTFPLVDARVTENFLNVSFRSTEQTAADVIAMYASRNFIREYSAYYCASQAYGPLLADGARIVVTLTGMDAKPVGTYSISKSECDAEKIPIHAPQVRP